MTLTLPSSLHWLPLTCVAFLSVHPQAGAQSLAISTVAGSPYGYGGSADGTGGVARFYFPQGLSVDIAGNLYVADTDNATIRKITPAGTVSTVAGTAGLKGGIDGKGAAVSFDSPFGTAVDSAGNIYVSDTNNFAIRMIAPDGSVSTFAGYIGSQGTADGIGTNARFSGPLGIAIDSSGNLYVADGNTIRRIGTDRNVTTLAGQPGAYGYVDGTGSNAQFSNPAGVAVDGHGNIYVADRASCTIRKVTPAGVVTTLAGQPNRYSEVDGNLGSALFDGPTGIAVDGSGNIFVSDPVADVIREIFPSGTVSTVAGLAFNAGTTDGTGTGARFSYPEGLAVDALGDLLVVDSSNSSIRKGVASGAPSIGTPPASQSVGAGTPVTFKVGASSTTTETYQWSFAGAPIAGATGSTYTTGPVQLSDSGIYSVAVSNTVGATVTSASLSVTFAHDPTFSFSGWTASAPLPGASSYVAVAYDGSQFVAVGLDGTAFASPDGVTWTASASNGPPGQTWGELNSIINLPGKNMLVAAGNGGAIVTFASATHNGTLHASGSTAILTGIAEGGSSLVAVGYGGASILSDLTASAWTATTSGVTQNLNAVAFGNGRFVAVGLGGTVVTTTDGTKWTAGQLGSTANLYGVAYGPEGFVAVGENGDIFISPDGMNWFPQDSPTTNLLVHVGLGDGELVAVGFSGTVVTSADGGFTWAVANSGTGQRLDGVAFGQNSFLLTGSGGVVVMSDAADTSRIINLSARSSITNQTDILIAGFVIGGTGSKDVLMRGIGPTLSQFGVSNALAQPVLSLYNGGTLMASNLAWGGGTALSQAFTQVGAFPLVATSSDTAILKPLSAGPYTVQLAGFDGTSGVGLAELYDDDTGTPTSRMINISARATVGTGGNILIAGFAISGNTPMTVLIRGVGPSLAPFGISSPIATPQLILYDSNNDVLQANGGWGDNPALAATSAQVGAFKLLAGSADAALLVTLPPGEYTAEMSGLNGSTGLGLEEIYEVP